MPHLKLVCLHFDLKIKEVRSWQHTVRAGKAFYRSLTSYQFLRERFVWNISAQMENEEFFLSLPAKVVCVLHCAVAAGQGQIASMKFLHDLYENVFVCMTRLTQILIQ